jgi:hypothetical protein
VATISENGTQSRQDVDSGGGGRPALAEPARRLFRGLSRLRDRRIVHPHGVGFHATLTPVGGAPTGAKLFDSREPREAIVRLSRSVGLPEVLPDPCGLAFRVPDAYGPGRDQDFLLVSSAAPAAARHMILPARGFGHRVYSSLLPYRLKGSHRLVGACSLGGSPGPKLAELSDRAHGAMRFQVVLATLSGEWGSVAELELADRIPDEEAEELCLDPSNTGGGLELATWLNRVRHSAYRGSQEGRGAGPRAASD